MRIQGQLNPKVPFGYRCLPATCHILRWIQDDINGLEATPATGSDVDQSDHWVLAFEVEKSLDVVGFCTPQWGGPATSMLSFRLAAEGDDTRLTMTDALTGHVSQKQVDSLYSGWTDLLSTGLKPYLEQ